MVLVFTIFNQGFFLDYVFPIISGLGILYLTYLGYQVFTGGLAAYRKAKVVTQADQCTSASSNSDLTSTPDSITTPDLNSTNSHSTTNELSAKSSLQIYCRAAVVNILNPKCFTFLFLVTPGFISYDFGSGEFFRALWLLFIINIIVG